MNTILQNSAIDKLPMKELTATLDAFMEPVSTNLPEKRLREVANSQGRWDMWVITRKSGALTR